jgi:hypothetical protein
MQFFSSAFSNEEDGSPTRLNAVPEETTPVLYQNNQAQVCIVKC